MDGFRCSVAADVCQCRVRFALQSQDLAIGEFELVRSHLKTHTQYVEIRQTVQEFSTTCAVESRMRESMKRHSATAVLSARGARAANFRVIRLRALISDSHNNTSLCYLHDQYPHKCITRVASYIPLEPVSYRDEYSVMYT